MMRASMNCHKFAASASATAVCFLSLSSESRVLSMALIHLYGKLHPMFVLCLAHMHFVWQIVSYLWHKYTLYGKLRPIYGTNHFVRQIQSYLLHRCTFYSKLSPMYGNLCMANSVLYMVQLHFV